MLKMIKDIDGKIMEKLEPIAKKIGIINVLLIASLSATVLMIMLEVFVM